jgi:hypothetical protein
MTEEYSMTKRVYYADETEHAKGIKFLGFHSHDKIFVFGGFSLPYENINSLKNKIIQIKNNYNIPAQLPIKWNFKDNSMQKVYLDVLGKEQYEEIVRLSESIREDVLQAISEDELDIQVMACSTYKGLVTKGCRDFFLECFANYLQRVGLDLQYKLTDDAQVVIDTPSENRQNQMFNMFSEGYYNGVDDRGNKYFSGPLKNYNIYPTLLASSDLNSDELQIADIIVGATKDFLNWVKYGKEGSRVKKFYPFIVKRFRRDKNGKILNVGLVVSHKDQFPNLESRLEELLII